MALTSRTLSPLVAEELGTHRRYPLVEQDSLTVHGSLGTPAFGSDTVVGCCSAGRTLSDIDERTDIGVVATSARSSTD
jgi:hypothetical protein